jgi:hypothetical protein
MSTAATAPDLTPFHHPHFLGGELTFRDSYGSSYRFAFRPFTGDEPEPQMPDDLPDQLAADDYRFLGAEYQFAYTMWAQARFRRAVIPMLRAAAPAWQEYQRATNAMAAAFAAFWETGDLQWRAQILRLTDTHAQAQAAARRWDEAAAGLARAQHEHIGDVGEERELDLRDVAPDAGLDIARWDIGTADAYTSSWRDNWPAAAAVRSEIERQKVRLKEVDELAPLRDGE